MCWSSRQFSCAHTICVCLRLYEQVEYAIEAIKVNALPMNSPKVILFVHGLCTISILDIRFTCIHSVNIINKTRRTKLFVFTIRQLGSTAVGIQTTEGVVLAVEKRITSPLLVPESNEKIMELDDHIGCAMSGLTADARTMINHARVETQVCLDR